MNVGLALSFVALGLMIVYAFALSFLLCAAYQNLKKWKALGMEGGCGWGEILGAGARDDATE